MRNLIVRPSGLGDVLLAGMTISSIKRKYSNDTFDMVVLDAYEEVAKLFMSVDKIYTIPNFYYIGNKVGEVFKRCKIEFGKSYDNVLNWQDEAIEIYRNKDEVPRVDLFLKFSPYKNVKVKMLDVNLKLIPHMNFPSNKKKIGLCMTSVSFYRSFDEEIIVDTISKLLEKDYSVYHFGFRKISESFSGDFVDYGSLLKPLELFEFINSLDFLVTVDTAAFHIACLLGVPCLAFFGEVNESLRTSHLNKFNGEIVCNNELECVRGECLFCEERPCLNKYDGEFILGKVCSYV